MYIMLGVDNVQGIKCFVGGKEKVKKLQCSCFRIIICHQISQHVTSCVHYGSSLYQTLCYQKANHDIG